MSAAAEENTRTIGYKEILNMTPSEVWSTWIGTQPSAQFFQVSKRTFGIADIDVMTRRFAQGLADSFCEVKPEDEYAVAEIGAKLAQKIRDDQHLRSIQMRMRYGEARAAEIERTASDKDRAEDVR